MPKGIETVNLLYTKYGLRNQIILNGNISNIYINKKGILSMQIKSEEVTQEIMDLICHTEGIPKCELKIIVTEDKIQPDLQKRVLLNA